jgi:hypothetical protein
MSRVVTRNSTGTVSAKARRSATTTAKSARKTAGPAKRTARKIAPATKRSVMSTTKVAATPAKRGRPYGSRSVVKPTVRAIIKATPRTPTAPVTAKMTKAEVEAHLKKVEASLARARRQIERMKADARVVAAETAAAVAQETAPVPVQTMLCQAAAKPGAVSCGRKAKAPAVLADVLEGAPRRGRRAGARKAKPATTIVAAEVYGEADGSAGAEVAVEDETSQD